MFYYAFSVISTLFVPCTSLLYDSTAATRILKLSTTPLSMWNPSDLMMSSLVCGLFFFQTLSFRYPLRKYLGGLRSWGDRGLTQNESVPWEVMPEVFKCYVREMRCHLISGTEHLNTSGITSHETDTFHVKPIFRGHPIPKISTRLAIF